MTIKTLNASSLTGGGTDALDSHDADLLSDGDRAIAILSSGDAYFYILDADSGAAESSPAVIAPDEGGGVSYTGNKRWILCDAYSVISFADGSEGSPSIYFTDDTDTGIFRPTGNTIGFTTGGTEAFRINNSNFLLGDTEGRSIGSVTPTFQINGTGGFDSTFCMQRFSNDAFAPTIRLGKSRGATLGSYTIVQNNDQLGRISFFAADGVDMAVEGARIQAAVSGTPGADDMPCELVFATTADGGSGVTEHVTLDSTGQLNTKHLKISDTYKLKIGTGNDGQLYSSSDNLYIINNTTDKDIIFTVKDGGSVTEVMRINGDASNVGIGCTPNSVYRLDVADGPLQVYNDDTGTTNPIINCESDHIISNNVVCRIYVDGDLENWNNSYGAISDEKLKENILDTTNKLSDIMKVKIRNFNFKNDTKKQIGVVAQELETVFPGLIKDVERDGKIVKGTKYSVLLPILIKAFQEYVTETNQKFADFENRLVALEQK